MLSMLLPRLLLLLMLLLLPLLLLSCIATGQCSPGHSQHHRSGQLPNHCD
jgi:hypothetical protein